MNKDALKILLKDVKTIAIVGASSNPDRDSFKVMKYLKEYGYDVYPVNPNLQNTQILGQNCYSTLNDINCLLYTSPSPRDLSTSRMPSSA